MSAIPHGSTVLITGATGLVGSGIAIQVMKAGYKLRAVVRNPEKAAKYSEAYNKRYPGQFETVLVEDIAKPGALDEAFQGTSAIIHTAGGVTGDEPAAVQADVDTALEIAKSAAKVSTVKRYVYTSSTNALTNNMKTPGHLTVESWNEEAIKLMHEPRKQADFDWVRGLIMYSAGKVMTERALFDFVKTNKVGFVVNTVQPNFNIGENVIGEPASSNGLILGLAVKNERSLSLTPFILPQFLISLEDDGLLHLAALTQEDVRNERIIAANPNQMFSYNDVLDILEKSGFKDLPPRLLGDQNVQGQKTLDNPRSLELLKRYGRDGFEDLTTAIGRCIKTSAMAQ